MPSGPDRCRWCGADILWATTVPGHRAMPIDPAVCRERDEYANVAVWRDHLQSVYCRVLSRDEPLRHGERRAVTHFATCPSRRTPNPTAGA